MLSRGLRRWLILAAVIVAVVGAYAAFGFLGVPRLLRSNLESFVSTHYSRRVSIGDIRFNPFTLTLDLRAFSLPDADGQPMLGFSRLFVNLGLVSIWRRGPSFQEIALDDPFAHVLIRPDGTLNLADLGKGFPPERPPPPNQPPAKPMRLFIDKLSVRRGHTVYEDRSRPDPFVAQLTPLTFDLRNFSTTAKTGNEYSLEGASEAGERFSWSGTLSVNPVGSRGRFEIDHLLAHTLWSYIRDSVGFEVPTGTLALTGDYDFTSAGNPVGLGVNVHELTVADLALRPKGTDSNYIELGRIDVQGTQLDLAHRLVQIAKVRVTGGGVRAWRGADNSINLLELASSPASRPQPASTPTAPSPSTGASPVAAAPAVSAASSSTPAPSPASAPSPPPMAPAPSTPADASSAPAASQPTWTVSVPDIAIDGLKVSAEDRTVMPAFALTLDPLNVHVAGFTTAPGASLQVEADAGINHAGKLQAKGQVSPGSGAVSVHAELTGLDLRAFQPYIAQQTSMTLLSGVLGTRLDIERDKDGVLAVTGDTDVTKLRTVDNELQKDFIKWNALHVAGIDYRSKPAKLRIKSIDTRELYARVIIAANQDLNIKEVLTPSGGHALAPNTPQKAPAETTAAQRQPAASASAAHSDEPQHVGARVNGHISGHAGHTGHVRGHVSEHGAESGGESMPTSIGTVRVVDGSAHFADFSVQPNYAVAIQSLNGSVQGLSSDPASRAKLKLEGKVDRYAPVDIEGTLNLLSATAYSDIKMHFKGVEMSSVTPYSGRFAGYKIDKGKLSADLSYHIENRQLKADHHIVIDQLQLGDKVDSPEATKLPLKLAIALLKDRNGVIDLGLPVTGSLDDPKFKLGPLIWKVVVNLLTRAATAPFALLGRLFGGGEQMNLIDFKPGSAAVDPATQDKLGSLAKAMQERPQLELDVPMAFSADLDRPVLAHGALDEKLLALQQKEASNHKGANDADPAAALSDPAQHYRLLAAEYRAELGKDAQLPDSAVAVEAAKKKKGETPAFDPAIADLENALLMRVQVTDSDLEELGKKRGHAVLDALVSRGGVDATRVFLINAPPKGDAKDAVRLELALK